MTRYEYRKLNHRCVRCNTKDAFTLVGKTRCARCAEIVNENAKRYQEKHREEITRKKKESYQKAAEAGLCPRCKKRPIGKSKTGWCEYCVAERRKMQNAREHKNGRISNEQVKALGLCWRCRKNPAAEGSGYCTSCLEWWESVRNKERKNDNFTK